MQHSEHQQSPFNVAYKQISVGTHVEAEHIQMIPFKWYLYLKELSV